MKQPVLRILVHRLPKILCGGCCFAAQNVFTGESKPAVSHKDSSGSHCHNALMPAHAEDNMPVRIHGTQRRVRDIIHNDYIRSRTFLNPSDRDSERAGCNPWRYRQKECVQLPETRRSAGLRCVSVHSATFLQLQAYRLHRSRNRCRE